MSYAELEQRYHVPAATIRSWKHRQSLAPVAVVATETRAEVGALLVDFLRKSLRTLSTQVEQFGDRTWLKRQTALELSHLFGTVTDRTFRLLEALEAGAEQEESAIEAEIVEADNGAGVASGNPRADGRRDGDHDPRGDDSGNSRAHRPRAARWPVDDA